MARRSRPRQTPGTALARRTSAQLESRDTISMSQYHALWANAGLMPTTYANMRVTEISNTLPGYMRALRGCPPAFAAQMVRALVLSQARFTFRSRSRNGRPAKTFGTRALGILERPWPNGTTGQLLTTMEWHAGVAGNAYVTNRTRGRLRVLRPDWVAVVYGSDQEPEDAAHALDGELLGYAYANGGLVAPGNGTLTGMVNRVWTLLPEEVAHYTAAGLTDPEGGGIGMSWLTPALRDMEADKLAAEHKTLFFKNAASPNMVVTGIPGMTKEQFDQIVDMLESQHAGVANHFKTLYLTAGADAKVIGSNFQQMDLKNVTALGEPLALDTPVPTPSGWTTMGEVRPGDQVFGRDGRVANVLGVAPVHEGRPCYRVNFKDGTSIVADADHLWAASDVRVRGKEQIYTTERLYEKAHDPRRKAPGSHGPRIAMPLTPVLDLPHAALLIDPYVLGVWLGDGGSNEAMVCGADDDLKFIVDQIQQRGFATRWRKRQPGKVGAAGILGLRRALRVEGLLRNKHIPDHYLRASAAQRLDILRGLFDTDGTVGKRDGYCSLTSKWEHLARQVLELARSLGYNANLKYKVDQRSRTGGTWIVGFRSRLDCIPFLLPRKVERCELAIEPRAWRRYVTSIEPVESVPVRCIMVDTEDHLFLAGESMVPTHNTRISSLSRVPASLLGISEGLAGSALNAGNFDASRRVFADTWVSPTLQDYAASLAPLVDVPDDAELWPDTSDMPILRDDSKAAAEILQLQAQTIVNLVNAGYEPESVKIAVISGDFGLLRHTGNLSVQLQPGGAAPVEDPFAEPAGV